MDIFNVIKDVLISFIIMKFISLLTNIKLRLNKTVMLILVI